jgi:hypothetical protein
VRILVFWTFWNWLGMPAKVNKKPPQHSSEVPSDLLAVVAGVKVTLITPTTYKRKV